MTYPINQNVALNKYNQRDFVENEKMRKNIRKCKMRQRASGFAIVVQMSAIFIACAVFGEDGEFAMLHVIGVSLTLKKKHRSCVLTSRIWNARKPLLDAQCVFLSFSPPMINFNGSAESQYNGQ